MPRLLVTGGAASLEVAPGKRLIDQPDFPPEWKAPAMGGIVFLDALCNEKEIDWAFFSPAAEIFEGPRLGRCRAGGNQLVTDDAGESRLSFADYAIAMADELEQHRHSRDRFTAAYLKALLNGPSQESFRTAGVPSGNCRSRAMRNPTIEVSARLSTTN